MSELGAGLVAVLVASAALCLLSGGDSAAESISDAFRRRFGRQGKRGTESFEQGSEAAMLLDLTAALLSVGVGIEAALNRLARTVPGAQPLARVHHALAAGASWNQAMDLVESHPELEVYCKHLRFAYATGAPSASMLRAAAQQARAQRREGSQRRAEELGVKMMLPLGGCFLPAFILLGVVPVVLSMLPEALGS